MNEGPDAVLRRMERNGVVFSAAAAAAALAVWGLHGAASVLAGALLVSANYLALKVTAATIVGRSSRAAASGTEGAAPAAPPPSRLLFRIAAALVFAFRYALLAIAAYVILSCLRLHPVGVIAGASAPVAAVGAEAIRMLAAASRPGREPRRSAVADARADSGPRTEGAGRERSR